MVCDIFDCLGLHMINLARYFRARCDGSFQACRLQQEVHHLISRDPDLVSLTIRMALIAADLKQREVDPAW